MLEPRAMIMLDLPIAFHFHWTYAMCPNVVHEIFEVFGSRRICKRYAAPNLFQPSHIFPFVSVRYCATHSKSALANQRTNLSIALFLGCATYPIPIRDGRSAAQAQVRSFCRAVQIAASSFINEVCSDWGNGSVSTG
jgi:hypothetical protein